MSDPRYINPWSQFVGCFLPNWLLERPELSLGAKVTYARLAQFAGRKGVAIVRRHVLAAKLATSERSVGTYLTELSDNGLIEGTRPGLGRPNQYRFLAHDWMQFRDERDEGDIPDRQDLPIRNGKVRRSGPADVAVPSNDKNLSQKKDPTGSPDGLSDTLSLPGQDLLDGSPESQGSPSPHSAGPPPPDAEQTGQKSEEGDGGAKGPNAGVLLSEYVRACKVRPPEQVRGHLGKRIKRLLDEGYDPALIRGGLEIVRARGLHPSALDAALNEYANATMSRNGRPATNGSNGSGQPVDEEALAREAREFNARQDAIQVAARSTQGLQGARS